jgi:glycosyltransferase involved in cell wall biosynthesis
MIRLAIFTTHPIQYQAPWFAALAAEPGLEIKVFFSYLPTAAEQGAGFGNAFTWDIPLLSGYPYAVVASSKLPSFMPNFLRRPARGLGHRLEMFKPNVAMVLGWQELSLIQAVIACRRRSIPLILRGESNALRSRPFYISMLHKFYFKLFDAFLAIGRENSRFYCEAGVQKHRIKLAGYFVDNKNFKERVKDIRGTRKSLRRDWGIPDNNTCFVFVGKLEPKKRVLDFITSIGIARDRGARVSALIVGTGEQMALAESLCLERSLPVTFAGFLNQSEMPKAYVVADVLVLPSDYGETWGLVVNEAMATGLPAIVSDCIGSANDLVRNGETGLVFPFGDVTRLADALLQLADDLPLRRKMGEAAQALVMSKYSITRAVEGTRAAIDLAMPS